MKRLAVNVLLAFLLCVLAVGLALLVASLDTTPPTVVQVEPPSGPGLHGSPAPAPEPTPAPAPPPEPAPAPEPATLPTLNGAAGPPAPEPPPPRDDAPAPAPAPEPAPSVESSTA